MLSGQRRVGSERSRQNFVLLRSRAMWTPSFLLTARKWPPTQWNTASQLSTLHNPLHPHRTDTDPHALSIKNTPSDGSDISQSMISYAVDIYFVVFIRNSFLSKNCVHEQVESRIIFMFPCIHCYVFLVCVSVGYEYSISWLLKRKSNYCTCSDNVMNSSRESSRSLNVLAPRT